MTPTFGTYVYCLLSARRQPRPPRGTKRPAGAGPIRFIPVEDGRREGRRPGTGRATPAAASRGLRQWLIVSDVPLDRYGEDAINKRLSDLDWVARAAVAHEAVIEAFGAAAAVLPMKLFTIFRSDARALEHIRHQRADIDAILKRVTMHDEWGVRIVLDPAPTAATARGAKRRPSEVGGTDYLAQKKAQRDQATELAGHAQEIVTDLYDQLAGRSTRAKRRAAGELPVKGGPLLLDAAFLVGRSRTKAFQATVARHARSLEPHGYRIALSGPWPPYSFLTE